MDSGLGDLDKILQSSEIENRHLQNEILKEQQQVLAFEAAIIEKEKSTKVLQEETSRLDETTKTAHQQFRCNKETYERLKNHHEAVVLNQETALKELQQLRDKWQIQREELERSLQHYESTWEHYKAKYEERGLAVELRHWQELVAQTKERLDETLRKVMRLEAALKEKQDKKRNARKPFKNLNDWIVQIAKVWAATRDVQHEKEQTKFSITNATRKIQEKRELELQQQKEREEQERQWKLKEAQEKKQKEELERQKQEILQQQLHQMKIREQQQQQQQQHQVRLQQQQQQLRVRQQQQARQQLDNPPGTPQQIPQSPLVLQTPSQRVQSQYFQSPLIRNPPATAENRANAVPASPQRQPPYLQMPISPSPRLPVEISGKSVGSGPTPQPFNLRVPGETSNQIQPQAQISTQKPHTLARVSAHERTVHTRGQSGQEEHRQGIRKSSEGGRIECGQGDGLDMGSQQMQQNEPGLIESSQMSAQDFVGFQDPGTPSSVTSLPPQSPFDLKSHLQTLNKMPESPGFTHPCRPMFTQVQRNESSTAEQPASIISSRSAAVQDNYEAPFFCSVFSEMGRTGQQSSNTSTQMFGSRSSADKDSPCSIGTCTSIFGKPDSPMNNDQSKTKEGVLSIFGSGPGNADKSKDDPTGGFSFNFATSSDSPNISSPGEGRFSLF